MTKPSPRRAAASSSKPKSATTRAKKASGSSKAASSRAAKRPARSADEAPANARLAAGRIIAVANQKGGVGKSTTAVSVSAALAELGRRVLVVDLDPQGNASTGLGIRHEAREVTVYDVLAADAPIEDAIVPTPIENLFAVPSTIDLAGAEIELVSQFSRELRLRKAIEPLTHDSFDYVFLDCPPSLGLLTVNALAAAKELIVPIQCEYYALEGLGQLLRNVRLVQQNVNTGLRLTGIVMTMFDPRTKLSEQVVEEVRRYFGDRVYRTIIPRTVRLSEAPGYGLPITVYDPSSKGAESYRALALEVDARLPDESPLPSVDDAPTVSIPKPEPARAPRPLVRAEDEPHPRSADEDLATVNVQERGTAPAADIEVELPPSLPSDPDGRLEAPTLESQALDEGEPASAPAAAGSPTGPSDGGLRDRILDEGLSVPSSDTGPPREPARESRVEDEDQGDDQGEDGLDHQFEPAASGPRRRRGLFRRGGS